MRNNLSSSQRTRLLLTCFLLAAALFAMPVTAQAAEYPGWGSGTPGNPYIIATPAQLSEIRNYLSAHFRLEADIDLSGYTNWSPIGSEAAPFTGSLDGDGHTIRGLYIDRATTDCVGLFGYIDGATLRNVTLEDAFVAGNSYVGGLVGYMNAGSVSGCSFDGSVRGYGSQTGGLVGYVSFGGAVSDSRTAGGVSGYSDVGGLVGLSEASIENCHTRMTVEGTNSTGGLVGYQYGPYKPAVHIGDCSATGSVRGSNVGGLVGQNGGGTVANSFSRGTVTLARGGADAGGLIGYNSEGPVSGCFSLSRVGSEDAVGTYGFLGGLIGGNSYGDVSNCYAAGSVSVTSNAPNSRVGGLIGNNSGSVTLCYAAGAVSGPNLTGGLVGRHEGSVIASYWNSDTIAQGAGQVASGTFGAAGITTAEMKSQGSFLPEDWHVWGFDNTWAITEGATYPICPGRRLSPMQPSRALRRAIPPTTRLRTKASP